MYVLPIIESGFVLLFFWNKLECCGINLGCNIMIRKKCGPCDSIIWETLVWTACQIEHHLPGYILKNIEIELKDCSWQVLNCLKMDKLSHLLQEVSSDINYKCGRTFRERWITQDVATAAACHMASYPLSAARSVNRWTKGQTQAVARTPSSLGVCEPTALSLLVDAALIVGDKGTQSSIHPLRSLSAHQPS